MSLTIPMGWAADPYRIYVSADGSDTKNGSTASSAVKTLTKAHSLIKNAAPVNRHVEVRILNRDKGGATARFHQQEVVWTYTVPGYEVRIMANDTGSRPIFDGCDDRKQNCSKKPFFKFVPRYENAGGIVINNIRIVRYSAAINIGSSDAPYHTRGNSITNVDFNEIGNAHDPDNMGPAYSAVTLLDSSKNTIKDCTFTNIVNKITSKTPLKDEHKDDSVEDLMRLIHGIYLAHGSSNNTIQYNKFARISGHAIKLRNKSNNNIISTNIFIKITQASGSKGIGAIQEWFSKGVECASWNNRVEKNTFDGDYACNRLPAVDYSNILEGGNCPAPASSGKKFSVVGNSTVDVECRSLPR
ncbi:MAG: hypothetical protein M9962_01080 [Oligoflexia bacterium]|nr:hypothetical protein [Oligoflexia bacterium]